MNRGLCKLIGFLHSFKAGFDVNTIDSLKFIYDLC